MGAVVTVPAHRTVMETDQDIVRKVLGIVLGTQGTQGVSVLFLPQTGGRIPGMLVGVEGARRAPVRSTG